MSSETVTAVGRIDGEKHQFRRDLSSDVLKKKRKLKIGDTEDLLNGTYSLPLSIS